MVDVLNEIKEKHCSMCKLGSCGKEIGYLSPGTSMDYAFDDLKVEFIYFYFGFLDSLFIYI